MAQANSQFEELVATSVRAMLASQRPNGALIASPDFAQYQYCWLRDGSFIAYALDRGGASTTRRIASIAGAPAPSTTSHP